MDNFPTNFNKEEYVLWHQSELEKGSNLIEAIELYINQQKENVDRLKNLNALLDNLNTCLIRAKKTQGEDTSALDCEILLEQQLESNYDSIFKSTDSIIDKLWRKNKDCTEGNFITTDNLSSKIKDLIRSSVIVSTQSYAKDLSAALSDWKNKFEINDIPTDEYEDISEIIVEQEAKMASGYFAYHVDVVYKDGIHIELQIYSQLNNVWRNLSHKLYEKTRLNHDVTHGHGTVASRLVSLGHLLHLAECEAERLRSDMQTGA